MRTLSDWRALGPSIGDVIIIFSGEYKSQTVNTDTNTMRINIYTRTVFSIGQASARNDAVILIINGNIQFVHPPTIIFLVSEHG